MSLFLLTLGLLAAPPARAGQWQVTYSQTGSWSYTYYNTSTGARTPQSGQWDTLTAPNNTSGGGDGHGYSSVLSGLTDGTVTATLTWVPAAGQTLATDPPSSPVHIKEYAKASWAAAWSANGSPTPSDADYTGVLADDGLGDSAVNGVSEGYHLIQRDGTSGTITLTCDLHAHNPASVWKTSGYPGGGSGGGYPGSGGGYWTWTGGGLITTSFSVSIDDHSRSVTISSDIEDSYYKSADPDSGYPIQLKHVRNSDGSMKVDASVVPNTGILGGGGYHADVTYTANPVNFLDAGDIGAYYWKHPGGSAGENETPADKSITVHYDFNAPTSSTPLGVSNTTSVRCPDEDGATASNTYTVNWHYPYENWTKSGHNYELAPLKYTSDGPSVAANGTYHVTIPPNTIDYSIPSKIVGGIGTVGAAVFAPELDPLSVFFLISVGYTAGLTEAPSGNDLPCLGDASRLSKDVDLEREIEQTSTCNAYMPSTPRMQDSLADAIYQSKDYNGYVSGAYGPPGLFFSVTVYQHKWHQDYIGDAYDGHGYAGQAPGYINWTGGYEYVYLWTLGQ